MNKTLNQILSSNRFLNQIFIKFNLQIDFESGTQIPQNVVEFI